MSGRELGSCKHALANTLHEDWQPNIYGRMFSFNLRTIQVLHVKGEQALVYRELELKVDALQDRS